ncbi:hypothetical protein [Adhaeribacter pallidiroseus]|uniref:Uncharacterized protein n=1 Tax=Adhaeribacter pallidiroseus TaxID=2072847 RepID=A0A369QQC3_9BACT|nr:hypothetical protein [Adhaeribacter pallidiroseus]RDC66502.1 hypothetical protein AHMF7616_05133 [Adhaeribacter pallidiroseus]
MKNLIFILLIAFSLFLALFFYRKYALAENELTLANQRILDRDRIIYNNQKQLDALKTEKAGKPTTSVVGSGITGLGTLSPDELTSLREKGITNPDVTLREDLISKQDILLPTGSFGGTMAIREVRIVNDRYALAYYEDGHNGGHLLLRFTIEPDKRINWKVLDRYQ